jgi:coenzyme F420-reducing hydrogenase beta subunit
MPINNHSIPHLHLTPEDLESIAQLEYPQVIAAWNKDESVRKESSSGGVFSVLATQVLAEGGIVVGASFTDDLQLRHVAIDRLDDLQSLRGSKYIQSDTGNIFSHIKNRLKDNKKVLFTGTPCQIAGLKAFLGKSHEKLLTCDLVCHGVPSEKLFRKYIKELETLHGSKARAISFRSKKTGWKRFSTKIDFYNGTTYESPFDKDSFMKFFLSDLCLRPSCYHCPYSIIPRQGDISLADYWGISAAHPGLDDDCGVSLMLINTKNGAEALNSISDSMTKFSSDIIKAVAGNPCIVRPVNANKAWDAFMRDIDQHSLNQLMQRYIKSPSFFSSMYSFVRKKMSYLNKILFSR